MKYSKKTALTILKALAEDKNRVNAAKEGGISYVTYCDWYNTKPEFREAVDEIMAARLELDKAEALQSIKTAFKNGTWQAGAWLLERKYQDEYALRKTQLEVSGTIEHKQVIINILDNETKQLMDNTIKLIDIEGKEI